MRQSDIRGGGNNYADPCFELCFFLHIVTQCIPTLVSPSKILYCEPESTVTHAPPRNFEKKIINLIVH